MINLKEKIPNTINEAIELLYNGLTNEEKTYITSECSASVHHFTGMAIRNNWGLWDKKSPIVKELQTKYGLFGHGDDCSGLILAGLWTKVKGGDVEKELEAQAKSYIAHWKRSGLNPATGEEISKKPKQGMNMIYSKKDGVMVACGVCKNPIPKYQTWCPNCGSNDADE